MGEAIKRQLLPPRALASLKTFQQLIEDARAMLYGNFVEQLETDCRVSGSIGGGGVRHSLG